MGTIGAALMPGRVLGLKAYTWGLAVLGLSYREIPSLTLDGGLCSKTMRPSSGNDSSTWSLRILLYEAGIVYVAYRLRGLSRSDVGVSSGLSLKSSYLLSSSSLLSLMVMLP